MKYCLISFMILVVTTATICATAGYETYFKFDINNRSELHALTRIVSIDNVQGLTVFAFANEKEMTRFQQLGYPYTILPPPASLAIPEMGSAKDARQAWNVYPTYNAYVDMMNQFENDHPGLCRIVDVGTTSDGRSLLMACISDNVEVDEDEPEVLMVSSMHGNETTGYVLMLRLIDSLLTAYGSDSLITRLIDSCEIWINPLANPDGTYHGSDESVSGATRYNADGIDLNRNYPDPEEGQHPDGYPWAPETVAMMNFADDHSIALATNFHGGAEVVNYPWDTWARLHVDNDWYMTLCRAYADSVQHYGPSGYMNDLDNGITNGYAWYEVNGGQQDFMIYWHGCRETTIEISNVKLVPAAQLPSFWDYNRVSFLNYMENSLYGIRGTVRDAVTAAPLAAVITIVDHDSGLDSSRVLTDPDVGDYHRMIAPGTYAVAVSCPGYFSKTVSGVAVLANAGVRVDVTLDPLSSWPEITTTSLPDWTQGYPYSQQLTALGGNGNLTWADKNGDLNGTGLTLSSSGMLSGTPAAAGVVSFTARVEDQNAQTDEQLFSLVINPVLTITTTALPNGMAGQPYAHALAASGGTGAKTWSDRDNTLNGTGLALSPDGLLSGSVSLPTVISFVAEVHDAVGSSTDKSFDVTIDPYFMCGDANADSTLNVGDAVFVINYVFKGGGTPQPLASADANGDGLINVGDAICVINYIFKDGAAPVCP